MNTYAAWWEKYIGQYRNVVEITHDYGYIVYRLGTGENIELLHIGTNEKGQGHGRRLFYEMLDSLENNPPYHSIFGFTRSTNGEAKAFYGALGFNLQQVEGIYQEGSAVLFWQSFERLKERRRAWEDVQ